MFFNFLYTSMVLAIEENHWLSWCDNGKPLCHWVIIVGGRPDCLTGPRDRYVSEQKHHQDFCTKSNVNLTQQWMTFCHLLCSLVNFCGTVCRGKWLARKRHEWEQNKNVLGSSKLLDIDCWKSLSNEVCFPFVIDWKFSFDLLHLS